MSEETSFSPTPEGKQEPISSPMLSPIRPAHPEAAKASAGPEKSGLLAKATQTQVSNTIGQAKSTAPAPPKPTNPAAALEYIRRKMEGIATEFGQGRVNRAQFNAIYGRYSEQRTIIERLMERNPENQAWKQAAAEGATAFLRDHFEARLQYYLVYQHNITTPLMMGGTQQPDMQRVSEVLHLLWNMPNRPKVGLARRNMNEGNWLVLAMGEYALTLAMFQLEPSRMQANLVSDLHGDFERANRRALERGTRSLDRFVFPQRALAEKHF